MISLLPVQQNPYFMVKFGWFFPGLRLSFLPPTKKQEQHPRIMLTLGQFIGTQDCYHERGGDKRHFAHTANKGVGTIVSFPRSFQNMKLHPSSSNSSSVMHSAFPSSLAGIKPTQDMQTGQTWSHICQDETKLMQWAPTRLCLTLSGADPALGLHDCLGNPVSDPFTGRQEHGAR